MNDKFTLTINYFRGLRNLPELTFAPINIITGDNNSGKTSLLEAVYYAGCVNNISMFESIGAHRNYYIDEEQSTVSDLALIVRDLFYREKDNYLLSMSGEYDKTRFCFEFKGTSTSLFGLEIEGRFNLTSKDLLTKKIREKTYYADDYDIARESILYKDRGKQMYNYESMLYKFGKKQLYPPLLDTKESDLKRFFPVLGYIDPDFNPSVELNREEILRIKKKYIYPKKRDGQGFNQIRYLFAILSSCDSNVLLLDDFDPLISGDLLDAVCKWLTDTCAEKNIRLFVTTHRLDVIDSILKTQQYGNQTDKDDISLITLRQKPDKTYVRQLTGRTAFEDRESFGFEARL